MNYQTATRQLSEAGLLILRVMTIEERAKLASEGYDDDGYSAGLYMGYVVGATEQKAIDIEKACEWLDNYLMEIGYPDDWLRDSINIKSGKERFRKAMDE